MPDGTWSSSGRRRDGESFVAYIGIEKESKVDVEAMVDWYAEDKFTQYLRVNGRCNDLRLS